MDSDSDEKKPLSKKDEEKTQTESSYGNIGSPSVRNASDRPLQDDDEADVAQANKCCPNFLGFWKALHTIRMSKEGSEEEKKPLLSKKHIQDDDNVLQAQNDEEDDDVAKANARCCPKVLKYTSTSLEVFFAVPVSGYMNLLVSKWCKENQWESFAIRHSIPAAVATAVFVAVGRLLAEIEKFDEARKKDPSLTFPTHLKNSITSKELPSLKLSVVGGGAFVLFGVTIELAKLVGMATVPAAFIGVVIGVLAFKFGNERLKLGVDMHKFCHIVGVFFGIAIGDLTAESIEVAHLVSEYLQNYVVTPLLPAVTGAIGALAANVSRCFWSSEDAETFWSVDSDSENLSAREQIINSGGLISTDEDLTLTTSSSNEGPTIARLS